MTICSKMYEALDKRLEEKKNLDEIGSELCDAVIDPRGKAIRLIKAHKGEQYLKDNAVWLGYETTNNPGGRYGSDEKNHQVYKEVLNDARSNGIQVSSHVYEQEPHTTIQSMQDEFEPEEVVYEKDSRIQYDPVLSGAFDKEEMNYPKVKEIVDKLPHAYENKKKERSDNLKQNQTEPIGKNSRSIVTSEDIGEEYGIDEKTVRNHEKLSKLIKSIPTLSRYKYSRFYLMV